jgi:hypothetical protein
MDIVKAVAWWVLMALYIFPVYFFFGSKASNKAASQVEWLLDKLIP